MNVNEIFYSIQGEGQFTGCPSVFVRLNGCNLRCAFAGGSICDTPYTSHHPESSIPMSPQLVGDQIIEYIKGKGCPDMIHVVFTGGEPMLQQKEILETIDYLVEKDYYPAVTIETNGTIAPDDKLLNRVYWSLSPKLSTSACFEGTDVPKKLQDLHNKNRINIKVLAKYLESPDVQLKFVYSGPESVREIKSIIDKLEPIAAMEPEWIMLMPEGTTTEQINKSSKEAIEYCLKEGWRFCDRLHIRIWEDKRAV